MQQPADSGKLHRYACVNCRSKKIKCDNVLSGCANCQKAQIPCNYSARRSRKPRQVQRPIIRSLQPADPVLRPKSNGDSASGHTSLLGLIKDDANGTSSPLPSEIFGFTPQSLPGRKRAEHGSLYVARGKSLYMDRRKANQVAALETSLSPDEPSRADSVSNWEHDSPANSSGSTRSSEKGASLRDRVEIKSDLRMYYPPEQLRIVLWEYYMHNFDPLVKIIYRPAVEDKITSDPNDISPSTEALLFAIWYATVSTMTAYECSHIHHHDREVLLDRYRYALERSLAQADWTTTLELEVLQALVILLVCLSGSNARGTWMLSGMCVSIAVAMGLHRDGTDFSLSSVEIQTRRRVWWTLCLVDNRISDECGLEIHIPPTMDTALPAHINDSDLRSETADEPLARTAYTDMTIPLLKLEMAWSSLKVKMASASKRPLNKTELATMARETISRYEAKYLPYLDRSIHLHHLCYLGGRLIITKLQHLADTELQEPHHDEQQPVKDQLILYHANLLEIAFQLPDENARFGWFFRCKYTQFHALAFLLWALPRAVGGRGPERAWAVMDDILQLDAQNADGSLSANSKHLSLWRRLLDRARSMRKHARVHSSPAGTDVTFTLDGGDDGDPMLLADHDFGGTTQGFFFPDPFLGWMADIDEEMNWR